MQEELYHHGILGQKWGIRRYQNTDGSLTDAGRKRYAKSLSKMNDKEAAKQSVKEKISSSAAINRQALLEAKKEVNKTNEQSLNYQRSSEYQQAYKEAEKRAIDYLRRINLETDPDYKIYLADATDHFMYESGLDADSYDRWCRKQGLDPGAYDKAVTNYVQQCKKVTNELLGKYGNTKMKNLPKNPWREYRPAKEIVDAAIEDWVDEQLR